MYPWHPCATWKHQTVTMVSNLKPLFAPHQADPSAGSPSRSRARFIPSHRSFGGSRSVTRTQSIPSGDEGIVSRRVASGRDGILPSPAGSDASSIHPFDGVEASGVKGTVETGPVVPDAVGSNRSFPGP